MIAVLAVLGIIEEESGFDSDPDWSDTGTGPIRPDPPPESSLSVGGPFNGTWYDQVSGINVVHAYVELHQSGDAVDGDIFNMQSIPIGSLSGDINGTRLTYSYDGMDQSGSGTAILRPDGTHMDVRLTDDETGYSETHVLHKNHQPK